MKCSVFFNLIYLLAFPFSFRAFISFLCPQPSLVFLGTPCLISFRLKRTVLMHLDGILNNSFHIQLTYWLVVVEDNFFIWNFD